MRERTWPGKAFVRNCKTCFRRVILALLGIVLGLELYYANAEAILGNKLPMPFGIGIANVLSGSMEPTFSRGTLLIVKRIKEPKVGDIVVYQSGKSLVVHRVVGIEGDMVITQGDANNAADEPFPKSEIKGVVAGWIPGVGLAVNVIKTPTGILLVLALAFFLMEYSLRRQKEEDEKELDAIKEEIRKLKEKE